jgi:hypothetical protein
MTITNLERGLGEVSDHVLGDLDPDERATLVIRQQAAGNDDLVERLRETAPTKHYHATDLEFSDRLSEHTLTALYALWDLETSVWRFLYERAAGQVEEANYRAYPDSEWTTAPAPENGYHELDAINEAVRFLGLYRGWKRYATEEVGVPLAEFLRFPLIVDGRASVDRIEAAVKLVDGTLEAEFLDEDQEPVGWVGDETVTVNGEDLTADELADVKYQNIVAGVQGGFGR